MLHQDMLQLSSRTAVTTHISDSENLSNCNWGRILESQAKGVPPYLPGMEQCQFQRTRNPTIEPEELLGEGVDASRTFAVYNIEVASSPAGFHIFCK